MAPSGDRSAAERARYFEIQRKRAGKRITIDAAETRGQIIRRLEEALALADEIEDGNTGYLIERALHEASARQFVPATPK